MVTSRSRDGQHVLIFGLGCVIGCRPARDYLDVLKTSGSGCAKETTKQALIVEKTNKPLSNRQLVEKTNKPLSNCCYVMLALNQAIVKLMFRKASLQKIERESANGNRKERTEQKKEVSRIDQVTMMILIVRGAKQGEKVMDIASSSSSAAAPVDADDTKKGEDTRRTFTSHLHAALLEKKIKTYIDDKLKRGDEISPALLEAIKESELSVIIFSKDYASSTWCLDELVHILECKEKHDQLVIPIFYDTLPSDVRKQLGSYAVAFDLLEQRFENSIYNVRKWRDALTNAADISGFDSKNYRTDADLVKEVVKDISTKLCCESSCDLKGYVGIESRIKKIESLLSIHSPDACITVCIWGMGGIGKTTLAEVVFQTLSSKFEASCFLRNVREREQKHGLEQLQKTLLKEILKEEGLSIGSTSVRKRLSRTKVLIVLDDVSSSMQMERLVGDRLLYGTGSRIIITTRDRSTLGQTVEEDKIYKLEGLRLDDALHLFCSRAFKNNSTRRTDYKELAKKAVAYAKGVPLALKVLGSLFCNCKSKEEWEDEFNKLKRFPSEDIQKVLRISYDRLGKNEKDIFLDIACFYKGRSVVEVKRQLPIFERFATTGIRILIDMSLISIGSKRGRESIEMHDLLQEMGRTIVQEQCPKDPGKRDRLFTDKDVYHVLKSNTETTCVEAIQVNWYNLQERQLKCADFKKMSNLIMLSSMGELTASLDLPDSLRYLYWPSYPLESLPSNFSPENLVELHMPYSKVTKELWKDDQILVNLQVINLSWSRNLTEVPNLSGCLKIVNINLRGCNSLVEIPSYFQHLDKLTRLDLGACSSLKYLPKMPGNITYLDLQNTGIKELPKSVRSNENISYLNMTQCKYHKKLQAAGVSRKISISIRALNLKTSQILGFTKHWYKEVARISLILVNLQIPNLSGSLKIVEINLRDCSLVGIPSYFQHLDKPTRLDLGGCTKLKYLPQMSEPMEHFKSLSLCQTALKELSSSICKLKYPESLDLTNCSTFSKFSKILKPMKHLVYLSLHDTAVEMLPSSIGNLNRLQDLILCFCKQLKDVPTSIYSLTNLKRLEFIACRELEKLPSSSVGFLSLEVLNLSKSSTLEIPGSIKQASQLSILDLFDCKRL
ncbi:unnamed protein product [Malus baccata var. baccata]